MNSKPGQTLTASARTVQAGNVLFLILIAVALFAALSYAVTSSTGSGRGNTDGEKAILSASGLMSYTSSLRSAIERLKTINNCSPSQLSFEHPPFNETNIYTQYPNASAPANKSCHVFHPNGGGVAPITGAQAGATIGITYTASCLIRNAPAKHFVIGIGGISYETCKEINKAAAVNAPSYQPPQVGHNCAAGHFVGDLSSQGSIDAVNGQLEGCVLGTGTAAYNIISSGTGKYWYYAAIGTQ